MSRKIQIEATIYDPQEVSHGDVQLAWNGSNWSGYNPFGRPVLGINLADLPPYTPHASEFWPEGFDPSVWRGWRKRTAQSIQRDVLGATVIVIRTTNEMYRVMTFVSRLEYREHGTVWAAPIALAIANALATEYGGWQEVQ